MEGDGPFDWNVVVANVVHPRQVAVAEALAWIDVPLSPTDLTGVFMEQLPLSEVAYHVRRLVDLAVLVQVESEAKRGWERKWFFIAGRKWESGTASFEQEAA